MTTYNVERLELGGLNCWQVRYGAAELLVTQQGAQILSYQRDGEPPVIWLSDLAELQAGNSPRGGVPVCWPWFGDLQRNPAITQAMHTDPQNAPFHGLVRNIDWQLVDIASSAAGVSLEFSLNTAETPLEGWPHQADLRLHIRLDEKLHIDLHCKNIGDSQLNISQALHSYFAVSDIRQVEVEGLADCRYIETLADWEVREQRGNIKFHGETDRIYLNTPNELSIVDSHWQRRIRMSSSGTRSAVVWNPWVKKAQQLSEFADNAWLDMLCIEHANVMDDLVQLKPGAEHHLAISLWSEAYSD
ncbi:D-hexose-6-phosphate mutarotase [Pseudomonas sp. MS19]|uniref:D-hexose-6-phosphate mutarotase n=1 Tax=Pseudomonas sp. MS19 TaxID=2579939 RepID=UPI0015627626|nr:D-hexose-6-phosphate mutarotase [Pseudomonas sp. MS19]NRH27622.1 D-hexose-6-phosphate mutarotase [Pseudomonas sp. MS19]